MIENFPVVVDRIFPVRAEGNLRAFANVVIGGIKINSCRVVQQPGQQAWVSMPQREYVDKEGIKKYAPVVELPDELKQSVSALVLSAFAEMLGGSNV